MMFARKSKAVNDGQVIVTPAPGKAFDSSVAAWIEGEFPKSSVLKTQSKAEGIQSLTIPRGEFRDHILHDTTFRRGLRNLKGIELKDVYARSGAVSDPMTPEQYIKDTRYNKHEEQRAKSFIPLHIQIRFLEDFFSEWGYVRIPAILILGIAAVLLYCGVRMALVVKGVAEEYAEANAAASTSEAGLNRAIQARSGIRPGINGPVEQPATITEVTAKERPVEK